jgi:DNA-binding transcriptional MerR regulator
MKLSLQQLVEHTGVTGRTIRFYIQRGVLAPPLGEKRGAYYSEAHVADLLRIRNWQEQGLSLDAIEDLLAARHEAPVSPVRPGAIEVRSHLTLGDGLEFVISADRCGLTQTQVRQLFHATQKAYKDLRAQLGAHHKTDSEK